jgi:hypothetical protein
MPTGQNLSFASNIRPLFTEEDVTHMKRAGMDLSAYDDVVKHADQILAVVTAGTMPPPADGRPPWSKEACESFKTWMEQGFPS